ncbi:RNA-binding, nab2-type zinc finger domain-containing protein [Ditylenchus destructor]|uniref:RNA-binding, nab2-type zinc finger domain-containing protein n=1 Tax=Ditylenchus destructor TaxID=166010 RepID=A0AAD4N2X5_9BILA|nr:RNA-binding, nab2-type zinc finger domain-containing protein [Ditylenchus destructor]
MESADMFKIWAPTAVLQNGVSTPALFDSGCEVLFNLVIIKKSSNNILFENDYALEILDKSAKAKDYFMRVLMMQNEFEPEGLEFVDFAVHNKKFDKYVACSDLNILVADGTRLRIRYHAKHESDNFFELESQSSHIRKDSPLSNQTNTSSSWEVGTSASIAGTCKSGAAFEVLVNLSVTKPSASNATEGLNEDSDDIALKLEKKCTVHECWVRALIRSNQRNNTHFKPDQVEVKELKVLNKRFDKYVLLADEYELAEDGCSYKIVLELKSNVVAEIVDICKRMESQLQNQASHPSRNATNRCTAWPTCPKAKCEYFHPTIPCKWGLNCKTGAKCTFLHPCKDGANCVTPNCRLEHNNNEKLLKNTKSSKSAQNSAIAASVELPATSSQIQGQSSSSSGKIHVLSSKPVGHVNFFFNLPDLLGTYQKMPKFSEWQKKWEISFDKVIQNQCHWTVRGKLLSSEDFTQEQAQQIVPSVFAANHGGFLRNKHSSAQRMYEISVQCELPEKKKSSIMAMVQLSIPHKPLPLLAKSSNKLDVSNRVACGKIQKFNSKNSVVTFYVESEILIEASNGFVLQTPTGRKISIHVDISYQ